MNVCIWGKLPINKQLLGRYGPVDDPDLCELLILNADSVADPVSWLEAFQKGRHRPVLVYQTRKDYDLAVKLLRGGPSALAQDYLHGNVSAAAILKRVQDILEFIEVGDLRINMVTRQASYRQQPIHLSTKLLAVLICLMERAERYVSYQELAEIVQGETVDAPTAVALMASSMQRLKKALNDSGLFDQPAILSKQGLGHMINPKI